MTASRGAFLALAVGLAPSAVIHFRALAKSRWTYIAAGCVAAIAGVWFATHGGTRLLTRGFHGRSSWSNEARLDMWRMASMSSVLSYFLMSMCLTVSFRRSFFSICLLMF